MKKYAKIIFQISYIISFILLACFFIAVFIFKSQISPWFMFFVGIAFLIFAYKIFLKIVEKEKRNIQALTYFERRHYGIFIIIGCIFILAALYEIFIK